MKAIIYCRQSSGDETLSESVELQKEKCRVCTGNVIGLYRQCYRHGRQRCFHHVQPD